MKRWERVVFEIQRIRYPKEIGRDSFPWWTDRSRELRWKHNKNDTGDQQLKTEYAKQRQQLLTSWEQEQGKIHQGIE